MKKLLFATALVASAAAFADGEPTALNAISFEGYQAGATFANGATEKAEGGTDKSDGPFFYYDGDGDGSSVKAFGGENAATPSITRPFYFASATPNANYLDLSTEGGTLWRSINNISSQGEAPDPVTYGLGEGKAIPADGLYLDTLVQFTPTEDGGTPELTQGVDKLAIWLNVETSVTPSVTNLMVRAAYYDANGIPIATNFALTGKAVTPGNWYRLTVKAVANVIDTQGAYGEWYNIPAFIIYIDGDEMAAVDAPIGDSLANLDGAIASAFSTLVAEKKVFPSLVPGSGSATLQGVGFKGSGALDDIVWTTEDPFANAPQPAEDYVVSINGSDVVITPTAADIEAFAQQGYTTVSNVNEALATPIPNGGGVLAWQALFLGIAPSAAGRESFKITSISVDEDGKVVVTIPTLNDIKTGRGVDIILKLQGSNDLSTWSDIESKTAASGTVAAFSAITPGLGETHKFYKVVVEFAASSN